jgi:hypothetical protein
MSFQLIQLITNAVLTVLLPPAIGLVCWYYRVLVQRLPEHQRAALVQFTRMAVQYIEYNHPDALDKHNLAYAFISDLFKAHRLPVPPRETLDVAIGSAMFEASSKQV